MQAADQLPLRGIVLAGATPFSHSPAVSEAFLPNPASGNGFKGELTTDDIVAFGGALVAPGHAVPASILEDIARADPAVRATIGAGIRALMSGNRTTMSAEHIPRDEIAMLAEIGIPIMFLLGTKDQIINPAYLESLRPLLPTLVDDAITYLPDCGHAVSLEAPEEFSARIATFARQVAASESVQRQA